MRVEPNLVIAARVLVAEELLRLAAPGGDKQRGVKHGGAAAGG